METITLHLLHQELNTNAEGHSDWQDIVIPKSLPADKIAIIVCDMWDNHWSKGAVDRVEALLPRMEAVISNARAKGVHIIHAPSETTSVYAGTPARQRAMDAPFIPLPPMQEHSEPDFPIDHSDGGSDTGEPQWYYAWSRQHPALTIDGSVDALSDDGQEIWNLLHHWQVEQVLIMGVHTNMCILNRPFAIKAMVRRDMPIALVRDLTDAMYNPAMRPYVSHDEGTQLVIGYIQKHWCPTVESGDVG